MDRLPAAAALCFWLALLTACGTSRHPAGGVSVLHARGTVNAVLQGYIARGLDAANRDGAAAVVIELDTPGGQDSAMRQIVQRLSSSRVPVIVYVAPTGARAASAGTFIAEAAALAVMAPGTNIGAASPVTATGTEIKGVEGIKVTNDAVALIRGLAQEHGRNPDWAESAVRAAIASPADEALAQHAVDLISPDLPSLLEDADGRGVRVLGAATTLQTRGRPVYIEERTLAERLLDVISDPNIAFLLLTIGGLGLAIELIHPTLVAGIFGGIALLTALFALGSLPTNWAGAALVLLAFALFVADVYSGGSGVLSAGGITSLILGGLLLLSGAGPQFEVSRLLVAGTATGIGLLFLSGIASLYRTRGRPSVVGERAMLGRTALVRSPLDPAGYVDIGGERWRARLAEGRAEPGESVQIVAVHGLELDVRPLAESVADVEPPRQEHILTDQHPWDPRERRKG